MTDCHGCTLWPASGKQIHKGTSWLPARHWNENIGLAKKKKRLWINRNFHKKNIVFCREILLGNKPAEERVVVMLSVPKEILKRRVDKRQGHYAKSVLIDSQLSTLELPATDEQQHREPNLLIVDGTLPVTDVVNSIIKRLHFGENWFALLYCFFE